MSSLLTAYLTASRRTLPCSPEAERHYQRLYGSLRKAAAEAYAVELPVLTITYSSERWCESVCIGSEWCVVYDQHLGQTLNALNRIILNASDGQPARAYAYKYIAQKLASLQCAEASLLFALSAGKMRAETPLVDDVPVEQRASMTALQELFVLAHEVAHFLARHSAAFREQNEPIAETALLALSDPLPVEAAAKRLSEMYGSSISESEVASAEAYAHRRNLTHGPRNAAEIMCDHFALNVTLAFAEAQSIPAAAACGAIILGLRHIRALKNLDPFVRRLAGDPTAVYFAESEALQLRESSLRWTMMTVATVQRDHFGDVRALADQLRHATDRHDELVDVPILSDLLRNSGRDEMSELLNIAREVCESADRSEIAAEVDRLTGWLPSNVDEQLSRA